MDKVYKFSEFILDKNSITLYRDNIPIQLSSRAFEMLVYLIENRGKVVEKDDILDKVWKDSFVEEANLPVHISALRRVLQEKKGESRFIRTISGRGYSFIANVEELDSAQKIAKIETKVLTENKNASIAILPFTIEQSSEDIEYLANGITQSLIGDLSTIQDLRVLAYSAVKPYKNSELELQEIGFLLDADKLLLGVISEYKGKWEISAELINAKDKSCLWATTETFEADDIFEVKKKISSAIVEKLKLKLIAKPNKTKEINSEAQKLYYRGKFILESRTTKKEPKEVLETALKFFKEAISIEPNYALAYVGIGSVYVSLYNYNLLERNKACVEAQKALKTALLVDENLSETYVLKGSIETTFEFNFLEAEKSLDKAIKINLNNPNAYHWKSSVCLYLGRFDEAIFFANKSIDIDPTSLFFNDNLTRIFFYTADYNRAINQANDLLGFDEKNVVAYCFKALSYTQLEKFDEALNCIEKTIYLRKIPETLLLKSFILASFNYIREALEILNDLLNESPKSIDYADVALVYLALKDIEKSFNYLNKAITTGSTNLSTLKIDPRFRTLHNDPRFDQ
ncbi:MAG: winged helix-turn-helix domain-containing protein, partial [Pyrinomonadaceae bacterium]|nr:winged helix-turn-helix domain-containing protein [Pyrinomonadaceae bacterium]